MVKNTSLEFKKEKARLIFIVFIHRSSGILSSVGMSVEFTAGLPISETHTKTQFADEPEGLR